MPSPEGTAGHRSAPLGDALRPPGAPSLELDEYRHGEDTVLELEGEFDLLTAPQLVTRLNALVRHGSGNLIIDLRSVGFADSVALKVLLNAQLRLTRQSRRLAVICGEGSVRRLFELTRLLDTLGVVADISQYRPGPD